MAKAMSAEQKALGKCYKKSEDGFYRLYKVDGSWAIYLVTEQDVAFGGHISDPENFEYGIEELNEELYSLMALGSF